MYLFPIACLPYRLSETIGKNRITRVNESSTVCKAVIIFRHVHPVKILSIDRDLKKVK